MACPVPERPSRNGAGARAGRSRAEAASEGKVDMVAPPAEGGDVFCHLTVAMTAVFCVAAFVALWVPSLRSAYVWLCLLWFAIGTAAFVLAIVLAGSRALRDDVGVRSAGLFLAAFAPHRLRLRFRAAMVATVIVSVVTALASSNPSPLVIDIPAMAYGILVPILPFALAGVHGARYCAWPVRHGA